MFINFGELAQNIKDFIDEMSLARQKSIKIEKSIRQFLSFVKSVEISKRINKILQKSIL